MQLNDRIQKYKAIEEIRERPLIVYATSTRPGVGAQMAGDAVREFIDQLDKIENKRTVDILIHSTGGDALAAWKLMSMLREKFQGVAVLVPFMAFSAATIFALGADEIVMHPHASLGPIDPQIAINVKEGNPRRFSFEDVGAFLRFVKDEIGITEQAYVSAVIDKLFTVVDPVLVGGAKRASELSSDVGERLLQMHMSGAEERVRARAIADGLNKSFFAHSDALSRSRARGLQLKIAPDNTELESRIWQAYLGLEEYMQLRQPFKPLDHFMTQGGAASLAPKAPLVLPQNTPQNVINQIWGQVAQQALQSLSQPAIEVPYSVVNAVVESPRVASEFQTNGVLTAARMAGGEIQLASTDRVSGWRRVDVQT
jgi:Serine dehydrogenase proteinase